MRKRIFVRGFVQGVGYRAFVKMLARQYGLRGKVKNLDDGNVEIIVDVKNEEILNEFIKRINVKGELPFEPSVRDINVEDYEGGEELPLFAIDYGYKMSIAEREMIERSEIGIIAFGWMGRYLAGKMDKGFADLGNKMDKGFGDLGEKIDRVSEKMDKGFADLGEKMDKGFGEMKNEIRDVKEEVKSVKEEVNSVKEEVKSVGEKVDSVKEEVKSVKEEVKGVREDTTDIKEEIKKLREDISVKSDENIQKTDMLIEKTEEFHSEMVSKFEYLDEKYGEFSNALNRIENDIREMKDAFIKLVDNLVDKRGEK